MGVYMKVFIKISLLVGVALLISTCASLTKEECLTSDWQLIGQRDGEQGVDPQRQFRRHINACEKANVTPDHVLWNQGYQQGLQRYCTPVKGLVVGQQGAVYNNVCPPESERGFLRGYLLGKKEFTLRSRVKSLDNQAKSLKVEIDALLDKIPKADPGQVQSLRLQINLKRDERDLVVREKESTTYQLSRIERVGEQFLQDPNMSYDPSLLN